MGHILRKTWEAFVVIPMGEFERKRTDEADLWRVEWTTADRGGFHSAEKPVALFHRAIRLVTEPGVDAVVLDPFAGSGTSGVAALQMGRRAILIEREAEFAEIIRQRCEATVIGSDWRKPEQTSLFGGGTP